MVKTNGDKEKSIAGYDIDYGTLIVNGTLQKLLPMNHSSAPDLVAMWTVKIQPKDSSIVLRLIKERFQEPEVDLRHLKRIRKRQGESHLTVLLCSQELISSQAEVLALVESDLSFCEVSTAFVPINKPIDKELNQKWSDEYWPIVWKGNPAVQDMNLSCASLELSKSMDHLKHISNLSNSIKKEQGQEQLPIITIFVKPDTNEIIATSQDQRRRTDLLNHSIMDCIRQIADKELKRRKVEKDDKSSNNYLCLNYHVYTTHEPCSMCSMALVHSRIGKLFYIKDSPITGAINPTSGCGYSLHVSCSLNWKYESWKVVDSDNLIPSDIDLYINV